MSEIILFRCYDNDSKTVKRFNEISNDCLTKYPVIRLYDTGLGDPLPGSFNFSLKDYKKNNLPLASKEQIKNVFTNDSWYAKKPWTDDQKQVWYNFGYPVLLFFEKNPNFDFYWSIEYDVYFHGNWSYFFDLYKYVKHDFLGIGLSEITKDKIQIDKMFDFQLNFKKRLLSFGAVHRYSKELLKNTLETLKEQKKCTFSEQLFPSVAAYYGMKYDDLNNVVPKRVYKPEYMTPFPLELKKFIYMGGSENRLYHSVK